MRISRIVARSALVLGWAALGWGCREPSTPKHAGPGQWQSPPPGYPAGPGGYGAPYSPGPYGQPPPYGPPGQPPPPQPKSQGAIGDAITAFGVIVQQLPQMPAQLPPLPPIHDWSNLPWAFPWAPPSPNTPPPSAPPPQGGWPAQWAAFENDVLHQTNQRRAMGALCGGQPFGPAGPVSAHPNLQAAARGHSRDMAIRNYFEHTSPEGAGPSDRAHAAGYVGTFVGENIAAGQPDPARVVQAWIDSPGHCSNLMDPRFRFLGVGFYFEQSNKFGEHWTQNFGG